MFKLGIVPRLIGKQLRNTFVLNRYSLLSNRANLNEDYVKESSKNFQKIINPDEEISPEELEEKSLQANWKDSFGSLTGYDERPNLDEISDEVREGEIPPHRRLQNDFRGHGALWYGKQIEKLGKRGLVYEATQILEHDMLVRDRVRPISSNFSTVIGILGRVGNIRKAFSLFNQMKKLGIIPEEPVYTALFNSTSNSPSKEEALIKAINLRKLMKEKSISINIITYQAMIKAFAHLGQIQTAFQVADEVLEEGLRLREETYSFLLMACIADKESGFSLAIKLWRMMRDKKKKFDHFHYNLLLRCTRDCGVGNEAAFTSLLGTESSNVRNESNHKLPSSTRTAQLPEPQVSITIDDQLIKSSSWNHGLNSKDHGEEITVTDDNQLAMIPSNKFVESMPQNRFPNILNPRFDFSKFPNWKLTIPKDSFERLMILGGPDNILNHMKRDGCVPTVKTFTMLMEVVSSTNEAEEHVLKLMQANSVKPDLTVFNTIIKKRCLRKDYLSAKQALDLILEHQLRPDCKTFGCLAMGCSTEYRGMTLLNDMLKINIFPNIEICDNLVYMSNMNFKYKLKIIHFMREKQIRPSLNLLRKIEIQINHAKNKILGGETGKDVNEYFKSEEFMHWFEIFQKNYKWWLESTEVEPEEIAPHIRYGQPTPQVPVDDS